MIIPPLLYCGSEKTRFFFVFGMGMFGVAAAILSIEDIRWIESKIPVPDRNGTYSTLV
jgi:hypothetical protein